MKYLILVENRHSDPEAYGPYDTYEEAEIAMKAARRRLWDIAGEDGSVEVIQLVGRAP